MIIFPAIDIKDGNCVRLYKGDFDTAEKVAENALEAAKSFTSAGARWLHTVDLDGAKAGKPVNQHIIIELAEKSGLSVEAGGGIRSMQSAEYYINNCISRVILGSAALKNSAFVKEAIKEFGDKIAVGIDALGGMAAAEGWLDTSAVDYITLAKMMEDIGVETIIYTDISKDGTLKGPNFDELDTINKAVSCNIIASGGIFDISDIIKLKSLNMYGAICGKSIYKGTLDLREAVKIAL